MIIKSASEVYLDANATTPVLPEAVQAAYEAMQEVYGNPSSTHTSGLRAKNILESTRELVAEVLGADHGHIIFTSGATEAIQLGIFSTLCQLRQSSSNTSESDQRILLYGATEHKAVPLGLEHWNRLLCTQHRVVAIPVDSSGRLNLDFIRANVAQADMVCTMAVNNETGVITDLAAVERAIRDHNPTVPWLVDCVQAVGKLELKLGRTTIDYASISGHKIYAPKGIGLLYARNSAPIVPLFAGGGQEHGARGGTENLPGVAAIAAVLHRLAESPSKSFSETDRLQRFRDRIAGQLKSAFPSIVFNAPFENSVPTTINFAVKGFSSKELLDLFDAAGIRVSSGSACGSAAVGSYVLDAMGVPKWQSEGAIRLSFGSLTTAQEIDLACRQIEQAGLALCESCLVVSPKVQESRQPLDGLVQLKNGSMCTWLLMNAQTKRCLIVDPFAELAERIESLVLCQESRVAAVLDTHAHVDHESCRAQLLADLKAVTLPSAATSDLLGWPEVYDGVTTLSDGTSAPFLRICSDQVIVQTDFPGHTKISRALLVGCLDQQGCLSRENVQYAFTGDMFLVSGIGRTDFESSDPVAMYHSLRRLTALISDETLICPTHDYNNDFVTTLGAEKISNSFLASMLDSEQPMSLEEFLVRKVELDAAIDDANNCELVCGKIDNSLTTANSLELRLSELKPFFEQHCNSLLIDVREPHEFVFALDWNSVGFRKPPENVPLTRLVGRLPELKAQMEACDGGLVFICRSGKRSGKAAEIARRLGLNRACSIAGGLALATANPCEHRDAYADAGFVI
jgi:cysteine sulfinate desulfinase/cysteine desulfurase-like protein/glyoxylase-like metal-dependent hydrolase (beta-lactamase superfamily II)/rhodanese-related sulfurtransferase